MLFDIKLLLTSAPILWVLDMDKEFKVYMNASQKCVGCFINARWQCDSLCIIEFETSSGGLCHTWSKYGGNYIGSKNLEALLG